MIDEVMAHIRKSRGKETKTVTRKTAEMAFNRHFHDHNLIMGRDARPGCAVGLGGEMRRSRRHQMVSSLASLCVFATERMQFDITSGH